MFLAERSIIKIIKFGVYAVLFLPAIAIPQLFFPFSTSRGFLFQIIVEIIFAFYAVLALKNPAYRPKKTLIFLAVLIYLIALFLSTVFGFDPYHSFFGNYERMWGFFQLSHFFLFFIILAGIFREREEWVRLLKVSLVVGALVAASGLIHFFAYLIFTGATPRASGVIGNPAFLAGYLFFVLLFSFFFRSNVIGRRYIYLILAFSALLTILFTVTRGALVGIVAIAVFGAFLSAVFHGNKRIKIASAAFLFLIVVGGVLFLNFGSLFEKPQKTPEARFYDLSHFDAPPREGVRFDFLSRLTEFSLYHPTVQTRLSTWQTVLKAAKENPFFGIGPENFVLAFNKYFNPNFYGYERYEIWFDRAHNIFIDTAVMYGVLGFAAYLFIFAACFWTALALYRKNILNFSQFLVFNLFFVAYGAQNFFLFDSFSVFLMFIFAIAYLNSFSAAEAKPLQGGYAAVDARILIMPLALVGALVYFFNFKPTMESYHIAKAESGKYDIDRAMEHYQKALSYHTFGDFEARSRLALAVAKAVQAEPAEHLPPNFMRYLDEALAALKTNIDNSNEYYLLYRLQLSDVYNLKLSRTGLVSAEIEDIIKRSIAISPGRMEFEFALAQTEFLKGNFEEAIRILTEASRKNHDHPMPYWKIAQNYHFMGNDEKGIPFVEKAFYLGHDVRNPKELNWVIQYYIGKNDYSKIIFFTKKALALSPAEAWPHMNLAIAYKELGEKDKAREHAFKVGKLDPAQKEAVDNFLDGL